MSEHLVILAIHDTTELDLTGKRSEDKLGCLMYDKQKGFFLHNTLLCSKEGIPQVIFHQHYWGRDPVSLSKKKDRKHLSIEEKESGRWVKGIERVQQFFKNYHEKTVINICDREGDIYELLEMAHHENSHYIVRSCNNRRIKNEDEKLWDQVKKEPIRGSYSIEVKDQQTKENHTVKNFITIVSLLGGYQKHNKPYPGIKVLWRGMKELSTILNCFALLPEIRCG